MPSSGIIIQQFIHFDVLSINQTNITQDLWLEGAFLFSLFLTFSSSTFIPFMKSFICWRLTRIKHSFLLNDFHRSSADMIDLLKLFLFTLKLFLKLVNQFHHGLFLEIDLIFIKLLRTPSYKAITVIDVIKVCTRTVVYCLRTWLLPMTDQLWSEDAFFHFLLCQILLHHSNFVLYDFLMLH